MYHFIYADHILGVETNDPNFRWMYGSNAPAGDKETFDSCKVKFYVTVTDESHIQTASSNVACFQCFSWCESQKTLFYSRKIFGVKMAYSISFNNNSVRATFGKNYYRMVRHRFMNLHDSYYLLSDLANILLLKNGYSTLYCAVAQHRESGRVIALFAPPNTGKSCAVKRLCDTEKYTLIAEDVALLNKELQIFGCQWTCTYRKAGSSSFFLNDDSGALSRTHTHIQEHEIAQNPCVLSDLILLNLATIDSGVARSDIEKRICILNKYRFCGYNSPIINVLAFFDREFDKTWEDLDKSIMKIAFLKCNVSYISSESRHDFTPMVDAMLNGQQDA